MSFRSLLAARVDTMAPSQGLVTDPDAKGANSTRRKIVSKLPVPKEIKANMDRTSKGTTCKAARLVLLASLPWQSWLGEAKDAQLKMSIADCITRKRANLAGEDEEHGVSRKTFQTVPGQIHAVNVPGTQWSEKNGNDGGLFHIEGADAPSTDCGESEAAGPSRPRKAEPRGPLWAAG